MLPLAPILTLVLLALPVNSVGHYNRPHASLLTSSIGAFPPSVANFRIATIRPEPQGATSTHVQMVSAFPHRVFQITKWFLTPSLPRA
jgi:hypothetical protein